MRKYLPGMCVLLLLSGVDARADLRTAHRAFESGDYQSAFKLLVPLAEAGEVEAQSNLAWLFKNGAGTEQNDEKAAFWYLKAAQQGDAYAQFNYARMLEQGKGVGLNEEEAVLWLMKAAKQGQANAQFSLGEMYLDGIGVEADLGEGYAWITVVVMGGVEAAGEILEDIEFEMSEEELKKAREKAKDYFKKYGSDS